MAYEAVDLELMGVGVLNLLGNALSALVAALERVVARWGVWRDLQSSHRLKSF